MKKTTVTWLILCSLMICFTAQAAMAADYYEPIGKTEVPAEIESLFDAASLIDLSMGAALYAKNTERTFSPTGGAVTLMTAYIVRMEADWEQEIPIIDGVLSLPRGVRKQGLTPGRRWLVKDLVAAMLLHGAQDAALVLYDHVSGSEEAFVTLMNSYAQELGMDNTVYHNPLGAYDQEQTTTVSDLLHLCAVVLEDDALPDVLGQSAYHTLNGQNIENRMAIMQEGNSNYDARVKGLGEGSTASAGTNTLLYTLDSGRNCLFVGYTETDDQQGSEVNAITLLDFFLDAYVPYDTVPIINQLLEEQHIDLTGGDYIEPAARDAQSLIAMEKNIPAYEPSGSSGDFSLSSMPELAEPVAQGADIGFVTLLYQGRPVKEIPLIALKVGIAAETETVPPAEETLSEAEHTIPVYSAEDWPGLTKKLTFREKYGSTIIIGAAVLLAGVVLFIAGLFRKKVR